MHKILLVEDNLQDEKLILRALGKVNLADAVTVVRDGQQALDYLFGEGEFAATHEPLPTVVIMDLNLPRLNGLEVLAKLRAATRTRFLPVVILTSSDEPGDRLHSYQNGANSFVQKPLKYSEFADIVASIGRYWTSTNIAP